MSDDQPPVTVQRLDAPRYAKFTRDLTAGEMTSLEKISALRALCGKYRAAIRDALDQLPDGTPARPILERALEDRTDG